MERKTQRERVCVCDRECVRTHSPKIKLKIKEELNEHGGMHVYLTHTLIHLVYAIRVYIYMPYRCCRMHMHYNFKCAFGAKHMKNEPIPEKYLLPKKQEKKEKKKNGHKILFLRRKPNTPHFRSVRLNCDRWHVLHSYSTQSTIELHDWRNNKWTSRFAYVNGIVIEMNACAM